MPGRSGHSPQHTGLEIARREMPEPSAGTFQLVKETPRARPPARAREDGDDRASLHVTENVRTWKYCRFPFKNNHLKSVTTEYEK